MLRRRAVWFGEVSLLATDCLQGVFRARLDSEALQELRRGAGAVVRALALRKARFAGCEWCQLFFFFCFPFSGARPSFLFLAFSPCFIGTPNGELSVQEVPIRFLLVR